MSQSQFARRAAIGKQSEEPTSLTDEETIDSVLEALEDADCRTVLAATSDDALSVAEISDAFDIAQSTAYRKVEALVETGLLEEKLRIRSSGNHVSTYTCNVEDVTLSVDDETGIELNVTHTETPIEFPSAGRRA